MSVWSKYPNEVYQQRKGRVAGTAGLVELEDGRAVRSLRPDFALLSQYPVRGVIVTARSDDRAYDFVSRFFAPRAGAPEDPVTGSPPLLPRTVLERAWGSETWWATRRRRGAGPPASASAGVESASAAGPSAC
jgi:hypothetical protein